MSQQIGKMEGNIAARWASLRSFLDFHGSAHDPLEPAGPTAAIKQRDAVLGKELLFVGQHYVAFAVPLQHGLVEKNVRAARRRGVTEFRIEHLEPASNRFSYGTFELRWKSCDLAARLIHHVPDKHDHARKLEQPVDKLVSLP